MLGAIGTLGGQATCVKAVAREVFANCESFFSHRVKLRSTVCALGCLEKKKGRARRPGLEEFAEPGTLSSTFPTNLPLPRSAPRGASSYRRPVLGAAGMYDSGRVRSRGGQEELLANCERPACPPTGERFRLDDQMVDRRAAQVVASSPRVRCDHRGGYPRDRERVSTVGRTRRERVRVGCRALSVDLARGDPRARARDDGTWRVGDQVVDHYLNYAHTEQALFDKVVTDWERMRYFERG